MNYLAQKHPHPRDKRIVRLGNFWYIDGIKREGWGVTRTLEPYFPNTFDADEVYGSDHERRKAAEKANWLAAEFGKFISRCAENFYNGQEFEPNPLFPEITSLDFPEWHILQELMSQLPATYKVWRVEWPLFATRVQLLGLPDLVLRDMAYPDEYRFVIVDFKCQVRPWDIPWCSARKKDPAKRTPCDRNNARVPWAHAKNCDAVAKGCLSFMFATKTAKCGAQMAIYRRLLLERYRYTKPVVINQMVGVFVKREHQGLAIFNEEGIQVYDQMVDEILLSKKV